MTAAMKKVETLTGRLSLRVAPDDEKLIRKGANRKNQKVTEYLIDAARIRAEIDLADRTEFTLAEDKIQLFFEALDKPVKSIPKLRKLQRSEEFFNKKDIPR